MRHALHVWRAAPGALLPCRKAPSQMQGAGGGGTA